MDKIFIKLRQQVAKLVNFSWLRISNYMYIILYSGKSLMDSKLVLKLTIRGAKFIDKVWYFWLQ